MKIFNIVFLSVYFGFFVGAAYGKIGQNFSSGTYPWYLPLIIAVYIIVPALVGYNIGRGN